LDTSTGGSGDGFSIKNSQTPNSTPKKIAPTNSEFVTRNLQDGDNNVNSKYSDTISNRQKLFNQDKTKFVNLNPAKKFPTSKNQLSLNQSK
jgi:hypothetical protein